MSSKIVFLIPPQTNLLDFAGASQVFLEAKEHGLDIEMCFCSFDKNIVTSFQLPLGKIENYSKQKLKQGDYMFVLSAHIDYVLSTKLNPDKSLVNWITQAHADGATICSICNGAFLLGKTGLLNGKKCTTHWKRTTQLQKMFPNAKVEEDILFIEDRGIISSAGATSGVDVALYILSKLKGDYFTYKISRELIIYNRRSGTETQHSIFLNYRNHTHSGVHRVQDWLQTNLHKKASVNNLANTANMSYRNFCRVFKKETSITVNNYITLLRKERIKELLKNPDISRSQIAIQCGLKSERQVSRILNN